MTCHPYQQYSDLTLRKFPQISTSSLDLSALEVELSLAFEDLVKGSSLSISSIETY